MDSGLLVSGPVEVLSVVQRRRQWPPAVKGALVAKSFAAGVTMAEVARRHGIAQQHLQEWRRLARRRKLVLSADGGLDFAPVVVAGGPAKGAAFADGDLTVEVAGAAIRIDRRTDLRLLKAVVQALKP